MQSIRRVETSEYEYGVLKRMIHYIDTTTRWPKTQFYICLVAGLFAWSILIIPYDLMIVNGHSRGTSVICAFGIGALILAGIMLMLPVANLKWYSKLLNQLMEIHSCTAANVSSASVNSGTESAVIAPPRLHGVFIDNGTGRETGAKTNIPAISALPSRMQQKQLAVDENNACGFSELDHNSPANEFNDYVFDADQIYDRHALATAILGNGTGSGHGSTRSSAATELDMFRTTSTFGAIGDAGDDETYTEWSTLLDDTGLRRRAHEATPREYEDYLLARRFNEFLWYNFGPEDTLVVTKQTGDRNGETSHVYTLTRDLRQNAQMSRETDTMNATIPGYHPPPAVTVNGETVYFKNGAAAATSPACNRSRPCLRCFYSTLDIVRKYVGIQSLQETSWRVHDLETSIHSAIAYVSMSIGIITGMLILAIVSIVIHIATPGSDPLYLSIVVPVWIIEMVVFVYRYVYHSHNV